MTAPDPAFDAQILARVIDWHDAPANAPRRLDLTWQDAVVFFGLPSDTPDTAEASWDRLYAALDAMVADGRMLGDLYVNRVRDLRPGYRGLRARDGDTAARLEAARAALEADRAALDLERARLDRMEAQLGARTETVARDAELLAVRAEKLGAAETRAAERDAALNDRETALERETLATRRQTAAQQARADADMAAARQWRMAGVGMVVLAITAGVAFAVTQGWV